MCGTFTRSRWSRLDLAKSLFVGLSIGVTACSGGPSLSNNASDEKVAALEAENEKLRAELQRQQGLTSSPPTETSAASRGAPINLSEPTQQSTPLPPARTPREAAQPRETATGSIPSTVRSAGWVGQIPIAPVRLGNPGNLGRSRAQGFAVHLGSFANADNLAPARAVALAQHGELLRGLSFRSELISLAGKRYYQLMAGPFGSESETSAICQAIENRGDFCKVSDFKGAPLE